MASLPAKRQKKSHGSAEASATKPLQIEEHVATSATKPLKKSLRTPQSKVALLQKLPQSHATSFSVSKVQQDESASDSAPEDGAAHSEASDPEKEQEQEQIEEAGEEVQKTFKDLVCSMPP